MLSLVHTVGKYTISETEVVRTQDKRRFVVKKKGARRPYVVTFQTRTQAGCSCIAGVNQKKCKHVAFCNALFK